MNPILLAIFIFAVLSGIQIANPNISLSEFTVIAIGMTVGLTFLNEMGN